MNNYRRDRIQRSARTTSIILDAPTCPKCSGVMTQKPFRDGALRACESCRHQVAVLMPTM